MCLGLDARTALWYTIAADSVWPPGNWTPAAQRGLTGGLRKQQLICAIRVAGWPARAGGLLLLHRRYPGVQPGRYLRSFLCIICRNYIQFQVLIWRKMRKIPGLPFRFLSFLRFKVLTPAAGSDILLLQTIAWFPRNWTSGSQRGLTGGLRNANTDLRHSGCRLACSCRRPPSFTTQIPRRWPDRYLRSFYAFYTGIIFNFESCFGGKW